MLATLLVAVALAAAGPAEDPQAAAVAAAAQQMANGHPDQAIVTIDPALAAYERQFAGEAKQIFCSYSPPETLLYMAMAATQKRDAVAIAGGWCDALFIKGYSLVDLQRVAEGIPYLERATAMAPQHAHFLNELGFAYQAQRDWQRSYDTYARARDATAFSDKGRVVAEKSRALRGMGYALIEQGRWDEAEAIYHECLALDPNDAKAKNELQYIGEQRRRPRA